MWFDGRGWSTASLLILLVTPAPAWGQPNSPSASEHHPQIIYTGQSQGTFHARLDFAELTPLHQLSEQDPVQPVGMLSDNVFRSGNMYLYTEQGPLTREDVQQFFSHGQPRFERSQPLPLLRSDYAYLLETPTASRPWGLGWLEQAYRRHGGYDDIRLVQARHHTLRSAAGTRLALVNLEDTPLSSSEPLHRRAWEMVPAAAVRIRREPTGDAPATIMTIGRTLGEGLRRQWLQSRMKRAAAGRAIALDLGNAVEFGTSESTRQRRAFSMTRLASLQLDGMVPAEAELALDAAEWSRLTEAVPVFAANLTPQNPEFRSPPPVLTRQLDGVSVAVVGLVDDRAFTSAGLAGKSSFWKVEEPIEAARKILRQFEQMPLSSRPEWVVLASNIQDERLQMLQHLNGASAVLADMEGTPGEVITESTRLAGQARTRVRSSLLLARSSPNRVGHLTATFRGSPAGPKLLSEITNRAILVTDQLPHDPHARALLDAIKADQQRRSRELLLPDIRDLHPLVPPDSVALPSSRVTETLWNRLIAQMLWRTTHAEAAFVRRLPLRQRVFGPVSRLTVEGWLEFPDQLVDVRVAGKTLRALAGLRQPGLGWAGLDPSSETLMGASIRDDDWYRLTTTDATTRLPEVAALLGDSPTVNQWKWLHHAELHPAQKGIPMGLRDHVISCLKELKGRHRGQFNESYRRELLAWCLANAEDSPARWSLRLEDGELLTNALNASGHSAFSQVRNTRVTAPSSQTLGGRAKLSVLYDSRDWAFENRARAVYKRQSLNRSGQEVNQETDDELNLSSEIRLKRIAVPLPGGAAVPFASWNYTTEFVPDSTDQLVKPRRSELAAIGGLVYAPGGAVRDWRVGAALKNDLANPGMLEPGLYLAGGLERSLTPLTQAKVRTGMEVFRYFPTATDTPDRLGLSALLNAGIAIPLWERFTLNVGADWFLFTGKVPETAILGSNLEFRVGLGYSLAWKPLHGVWF
ncbi:MAG: hypothetical protein VKP62_08725 [Candidatus Sericytochromatia bacterium]|nr:hypothetical protein [Candidatus Sericytochromatia bacterium]